MKNCSDFNKMLCSLNLNRAFEGTCVLKAHKQLESSIFVVIMILIISNNGIDGRTIEKKTYEEISMPETVIQCRTACVHNFLIETDNPIELLNCREHNNCAMCWDFCQMLFVEEPKVIKSICSSQFCVSFNK